MAERFIATVFTSAVLDAAAAEGLDVDDHRRSLQGHESIPQTRHYSMWADVMRRLDQPDFPIRYARRMSIDGYGVLGLAVKTAANLRAALHRVARHVGIWTDTVSFEIEETSDRMIVRLVRPGARTLGVRAATEAMVAEIVHMLRVLADEAVDPTAVFFTHRTPARTELESFFRTSVQTESPKDAFELPAAAAALSVRHADAAMSTFFEDHLARLAPARADESMVAAVADVVRRLLGDGPPKIDAVASQLNMSVRSLQRRMSDEGSSFRDVVDEARRIAACDHLRSTELPIGEIAFLVGFSEVSAFHRAFRRWMKTTPTAFRERTGR